MRTFSAILLLALFPFTTTLACVCFAPQPLEQRYTEATAVFYAEIDSLTCLQQEQATAQQAFIGRIPIEINMTVTQVLKGNPAVTEVAIGSTLQCPGSTGSVIRTSCDINYLEGDEYLIFQTGDKPPEISFCSGDAIKANLVPHVELQKIIERFGDRPPQRSP